MSLGLPAHLAREANSRAIVGAAQAAALVCIAGSAASILFQTIALGTPVPWWALAALVPMAAVLVALTRRPGVALALLYLVAGGLGTVVYTISLLEQTETYRDTNLFVVALPVAALVMIGGSASGSFAGVLWASAGFAVGESAVALAALVTGRPFVFSWLPIGAYLIVVGVLLFDGLTRNRPRRAQAFVLRAVRAEQAASLRHEVARQVAADLHDTALNRLALIAGAEPGPLSPALRQNLERDLESWGRDRVAELQAAAAGIADRIETWSQSALATAIEQARDGGLMVEVTGDIDAVARLDVERGAALGQAVRQCLTNVVAHAGVESAEVALSASAAEVQVMVVDAGAGFDPRADVGDRLGLKHSVRDRIAQVGGSVTVFSRPGSGTSVLMVVPVRARDASIDAEES
jgi:signal transduction histidine kinase